MLRVSGLPHSEKIKYLNSEDATVAHVVSIREEAPTAAEVEAAAAAAAAAAATAAAEPEVAKKGGKPEDAAAAKKPEAASSGKEARGEEVSLGRGKPVRSPQRIHAPPEVRQIDLVQGARANRHVDAKARVLHGIQREVLDASHGITLHATHRRGASNT